MIANRIRFGLASLVVAGTCVLSAPPARAQFGGGGGPPPAIMAKIKLWQKWGAQHKNVSQLQRQMMQLPQLDQTPTTRFTKPQAAKLLSIMNTWGNKPTMNEDQAKSVNKQIGDMLTIPQIKKMATFRNPFGGGGGGGGFGGGGRPGGGGPPGGGRPGGFTFPDPPNGSYNPLNPDTSPFVQFRSQAKARMNQFTASLQQRARG